MSREAIDLEVRNELCDIFDLKLCEKQLQNHDKFAVSIDEKNNKISKINENGFVCIYGKHNYGKLQEFDNDNYFDNDDDNEYGYNDDNDDETDNENDNDNIFENEIENTKNKCVILKIRVNRSELNDGSSMYFGVTQSDFNVSKERRIFKDNGLFALYFFFV